MRVSDRRQPSIPARISLRNLAATMAVTPLKSRSGLSSTMSAPMGGWGRAWRISRTSRVEEAAGLVVGDAGGEGGVEDVEVEREVDGRLK